MIPSQSVTRIINIANTLVAGQKKKITPIHLLYACCMETSSLASAYLESEGITATKINKTPSTFFADKSAAQIIALAEIQSLKFNEPVIVSEALLYVLCLKCDQSKSILEKISTGSSKRIAKRILSKVGYQSEMPTTKPMTNPIPEKIKEPEPKPEPAYTERPYIPKTNTSTNQAVNNEPVKSNTVTSTLSEEILVYGKDLTAEAKAGKIDKIIGRDDETNRMIEILCRKTKNNPILIGEAGVGKSAIIEGLAKRIIANKVPHNLQNKLIFSLDIGLLIGGSKYRGELEARLNKVIKELNEREDIILFIDEIHNIATSGNKDGEMGIGELLKPSLARGSLHCIGATTIDEYRKYIEKDPALDRRFAPIMVNPPTPQQTVEILEGLCGSFENFHNVEIESSAILAAVTLSNRYIFDRNLPDKAIDVLDEACAKSKVRSTSINPVITKDNIAEVVSEITKVPLSKINSKDKESLMSLEEDLSNVIIGQDKAISAIAKAIRRTRSGIADQNRPVGSFFFLGRTGVGKTEVCKQLSAKLFDSDKSFIKLDMSEYSEAHSVSKMIGAPAGYVGYEDSSILCDRVRRNPYCLVLFDEIEKAHSEIYNLMLQILDEGQLTDSHGKKISFKNAIIVMTSNIGVSNIPNDKEIGDEAEEEIILQGMKDKFSPEFINRIDSIVVFNALSMEDVKKVARIHLEKLKKKLAAVDVDMTYTDGTVEQVAKRSYSKEYGVRPLRRTIQTEIEDRISEEIIAKNIKSVCIDIT